MDLLASSTGQMLKAVTQGKLSDDKEKDKTKRHLSHQKNIALRMCFTLTIVPLLLWCCYFYLPIKVPRLPTMIDRLVYTIKWQWPSVMLIMSMVQVTSLKRLTSDALNPIEGTEQHMVQIHKNVLTNTLEQYIMNVFALLMLTTYLEEGQMKIIPLLVAIFVIGRIQYWTGYTNPKMGRSDKSVGYVMSCFGTFVILIYCGYSFCLELL